MTRCQGERRRITNSNNIHISTALMQKELNPAPVQQEQQAEIYYPAWVRYRCGVNWAEFRSNCIPIYDTCC